MRDHNQTHPGRKQLACLSPAIDELTGLHELIERAIKDSDKLINDNGPSIADLRTFITNMGKGMMVKYTTADKVIRHTLEQVVTV